MQRGLFTALALMLATSAFAGEHRVAVMDLLNAFEIPGSEADFKKLGDGVDAELMEIADDGEVPSSRRGRAVSALQWYANETVRGFLQTHLTDAKKSLIRRKAAYALAGGWGAGAVAPLSGALKDEDVQVRIATVNALGNIDHDKAREVLRAHLPNEKDDSVKEAINKQLSSGKGGR